MNSYPHMCRDDHEEIGYSDSEHERCPLCRTEDHVTDLAEDLALALTVISTSPEIDTGYWIAAKHLLEKYGEKE